MKRIKMVFMMLAILFLGGCVKYDLTTGVNTDKSITITLITAIQKDYYAADDGKTKESYEDLGFSVIDYEDTNHKGYKLIKIYNSIDLISSSDCTQVEITKLLSMDLENLVLFKSSKVESVTTYSADFVYDLTAPDATTAESDYSEYTEDMEFKYTMTLPSNSKIISENADEKTDNGYTLIWNIKYGETKDIDFVFSIDDVVVSDPVLNEEKEFVEEEKENVDNEKNETIIEEKLEEDKQKDNVSVDNDFTLKDIISTIVLVTIIVVLIIFKVKMKKGLNSNKHSERYHSSSHQK